MKKQLYIFIFCLFIFACNNRQGKKTDLFKPKVWPANGFVTPKDSLKPIEIKVATPRPIVLVNTPTLSGVAQNTALRTPNSKPRTIQQKNIRMVNLQLFGKQICAFIQLNVVKAKKGYTRYLDPSKEPG